MKVTPYLKNFGSYKPGDVFDFPDKAAPVFIKANKLRKVMESEVEISERTGKPKRQYRRRDMVAE